MADFIDFIDFIEFIGCAAPVADGVLLAAAGALLAAGGELLAAGGGADELGADMVGVLDGDGVGEAAGGVEGGLAGASIAAGGELAAGAEELSAAPLCCAKAGSDPATNAAIATPPNQIRVFMGYVLFSLGFRLGRNSGSRKLRVVT